MYKIAGPTKYFILLLVFLFQVNISAKAQVSISEAGKSFKIPELIINDFQLFEKNEILELTLMFDITSYMEEKPQEEYMEALLSYNYNGADSINKLIRLRARGNYRYRTCEFPPIRLNFKDTSFGFPDLDSLNNVKMVTHCIDSSIYQEYLMREYLIYKLYNIVSDYSFKVRFLKVHYLDTGTEGLHSVQYGFLIEPLDRLLFRLNALEIEDQQVVFKDVEPELMDKIAIFQMMIGNTDWSLPMIHNFKILKKEDNSSPYLIPIPYDYDYSGFVNTHYAMPASGIGDGDIKDRVYQGPCRSEEEFRARLEEFLSYKEVFIDVVKNFEYLDRSIRKDLSDYINSFYNLYKKDVLLNQILEDCVKEK